MPVRLADLNDSVDAAAVVELLDMYSQDEFGGSVPLSPTARNNLIPGLIKHGGARVFLAYTDAGRSGDAGKSETVGLAICLIGFSTFRGAPLLNVHDLAVSPNARGLGVGTALLAAIDAEAQALGCCRITLEVRSDNLRAQAVYERAGYRASAPQSWFWMKPFDCAR